MFLTTLTLSNIWKERCLRGQTKTVFKQHVWSILLVHIPFIHPKDLGNLALKTLLPHVKRN